ncbi:MAG: polysaccharide deacetylase family protein, partial [Gemmatimonadaceae bacterium]
MNTNSVFITGTDILGAALWRIGVRRPVRRTHDIRLVFYHGIGNGDGPCFRYLEDETPLTVFEHHLDYLQQYYSIVPLATAVREVRLRTRTDARPICSISFDDGLRSVFTGAFPALRKRGLPATVFLNTETVGNARLGWIHLANYLLSEHGARAVADTLNHVRPFGVSQAPAGEGLFLAWCRANYSEITQADLLARTAEALGVSIAQVAEEQRVYLDWDEIEAMRAEGITFCSHTHS